MKIEQSNRSIIHLFFSKSRAIRLALALAICVIELCSFVGLVLLPAAATGLLRARGVPVVNRLVLMIVLIIAVYGFQAADTYLKGRLEVQVFRFRFDYITVFSKHIFGWQQSAIDSVAGKTAIDQGYEAIYNGQSVGIGAIVTQFLLLIRLAVQTIVLLLMLGTVSMSAAIVLIVCNVFEYGIQMIANRWYGQHKPEQNALTSYQSYFERTLMKRTSGPDIRVFNMQPLLHFHLQGLADSLVGWQKQYTTVQWWINVAAQGLNILALGLCLLLSIANANTSLTMVVFIVSAVQMLNTNIGGVRDAATALGKNQFYAQSLAKFLAYHYDPVTEVNEIVPFTGYALSGVRYAVGGTELIHDLSLSIHPGERVAIVGENGAGKSTLIKLMAGLYQPQSGTVLLNGTPVVEQSREQLNSTVAVQFQDDLLLHFSIAENIACKTRNEIDDQRVVAVIAALGLTDFVAALPHGIDTVIGNELADDGVELSGGQAQSLLFGRLIYRQAEVNILDEPTSALDAEREAQFYDLLEHQLAGKAVVIVTHRLGSFVQKAHIVVMRAGAIIAAGTHAELLKSCPYYAQMWQAQKQLTQGGVDHATGSD
ncbi:ATP-binding cassette domain-containing protein [Lacticaseibacillus zhaodongensis]|uniref:ATP-binding cassette domain-containing protein n=1 Tax=Lacticaseibacillus zhaodongensis TaxID=2668065 RepID=UPI0012D326FA|nr:ABC transporter ATP-binding protein [Lacticaseibacillus zhaodongensis]